MVFVDRSRRMLILIMTILLLDCFRIGGFSFSAARDLAIITFAIMEIRRGSTCWRQLRQTVIPWLLLIVATGDMILIFHSPHLRQTVPIVGFILSDLAIKTGALAYGFLGIADRRQIASYWKPIFCALLFLTFMGLVEVMFGSSPLHNLLGIDASWRNEERNRATSIFISPFDYGYINILLLIYFLYLNRHYRLEKWVFWTAVGCCLIGVIICGCRTVLATFLISIVTYSIFAYNIFRNAGVGLIVVILTIFAYSYIPAVQEKADFLLSAVGTDTNIGGSSAEMRMRQYTATLYYVRNDMWFGRGYNFFNIDMGWDEGGFSTLRDDDLMGLEGILMSYMLERGIVGCAFYLLFYGTFIIYIFIRRPRFKQEAACIITLLIACVSFGNMTGELGSVLPTLLFCGMYYKIGLIRYRLTERERRHKEAVLHEQALREHLTPSSSSLLPQSSQSSQSSISSPSARNSSVCKP